MNINELIEKLPDDENIGITTYQTEYACSSNELKALAAAVPRWVPCEERMPDEREWVLVEFEAFEDEARPAVRGYLRYAAGDENAPYFVTPAVSMLHRKPVAWMPIPSYAATNGPQVERAEEVEKI